MSFNGKLTIRALRHEKAEFLPRGELFINQNFLNHYLSDLRGNYVGQIEKMGRWLDLQVVGVDLNRGENLTLLREGAFKRLEDFFTVACLNGPLTRLIEAVGFLKALGSLKSNPSLLLKTGADHLKEMERRIPWIQDNEMKAVAVTDDIAGNQGPFFSPDDFEKMILPCYRRFSEIIKSNSLYAFFHSDGNLETILERFIDANFDCLHTFDATAGMDLYKMRSRLGDRVCFMGHIDVLNWERNRVQREMAKAKQAFSSGGLILGSSSGISVETVNDNLPLLYPGWKKRI